MAQAIALKNVGISVYLLPKGSEDVSSITRTLTVDAAITEGAESISLVADTAVDLPVGASIVFKGASTDAKQIIVAADTNVGTSATSVPIYAVLDAIPATETGTFYDGLLPLLGIQEFGYSTSPTEVDTTTTLSGPNTEVALVRAERSISASGIAIPGNKGYWDTIVNVADTGGFFGRNIYVVESFPNGLQREGVAVVTDYSEDGDKDNVMKYSLTFKFVGNSYKRNSPYHFA